MRPATKTAVAKCAYAWGNDMPDWVRALRDECVFHSQNSVAKRLGVSGSLVSQTLTKKYTGSYENIERKIREVLMRDVVDCPKLGEVELSTCSEWAEKAAEYLPSNPQRVKMFRACNKCPHNRSKGAPNDRDTATYLA